MRRASHVLDLRAEFAREFILPALQAGAVYEDRYPLATALGRPLIAKHLVEIAHLEGASAVAHGMRAEKGNDAVRIEAWPSGRWRPDLNVFAAGAVGRSRREKRPLMPRPAAFRCR